jgi:hypothetical protein
MTTSLSALPFFALTLLAAVTPIDRAAAEIAIPFAPLADNSLKDPDNPTKVFRIDFARVEREFPLSRADRAKLTAEDLATLSQEQIDQLYGRLTAGPIPNGPFRGNLFFARGDSLRTRLDEILGGIGGRIAGTKIELFETLGRALWKGKMFYRDERVLRNFIEDAALLRPFVGDPRSLMTATIPRTDPLHVIIPRNRVWLLFPAKLFCGQSLVDSRRESVIIDYAYGDEVAGYRKSPDSLAGRNGLRIRDEVRMVRPGLYLGRAYANRMFLLNFTLYNPMAAERDGASFAGGAEIVEDCWPGEQIRQATAR